MTRGLQLGVLATATSSSRNKKIGDCAVTYAAQASCPSSCAFKDGGGCYAENGRIFAGVTRPLNETAAALTASPVDWSDLVIGFAVHGTASTVKAATKALRDPDDPDRRLTSRDHALRLLGELGRWPTVRELCVAADVVDASAREMLARLGAESVRPFEVAA